MENFKHHGRCSKIKILFLGVVLYVLYLIHNSSIKYNTSTIYMYIHCRLIEHISLASPCPLAFPHPIRTIRDSRSFIVAVFFMLLQQSFSRAKLLHASN